MAFDSAGFEPRLPQAQPPPRRSRAQERVLCVALMLLAVALLIAPVSAEGLIDLVRFLWPH